MDETQLPMFYPLTKQQSMQWGPSGRQPHTKPVNSAWTRNIMCTVWFDACGVLMVDYLPEKTTINSAYVQDQLARLRAVLLRKRRIMCARLFILWDNARPHVAAATTRKVEELGFCLLNHPPYSPNLAIADVHLFGAMKKLMRGRVFTSREEFIAAANESLHSLPASFWEEGVDKLLHRYEKRIQLNGGFVQRIEIVEETDEEPRNTLFEISGAFDVNNNANAVYNLNFPGDLAKNRSVEALTCDSVCKFNANTWVMSPPCQPFSRLGHQQGLKDPRCKAFLHIIHLLKSLQVSDRPTYLLLENVKGFESSDACQLLLDTLDECGYIYQQFLLTPIQFGIPNSRLRYYLIATLNPAFVFQHTSREVFIEKPLTKLTMPGCQCLICTADEAKKTQLDSMSKDRHFESYLQFTRPLNEFIDESDVLSSYEVPAEALEKFLPVVDIVSGNDKSCCCFTKGYGRRFESTGSLLRQDADDIEHSYGVARLRFFTPCEISRIMGFPVHFSFPDHLTRRQCYQLLGNSVNVVVVAHLFFYMFSPLY